MSVSGDSQINNVTGSNWKTL